MSKGLDKGVFMPKIGDDCIITNLKVADTGLQKLCSKAIYTFSCERGYFHGAWVGIFFSQLR